MTDPFVAPPITQKLSAISEVMSDGFYFIHFRVLMEDLESQAANGDDAARQLIVSVTQFHNLCMYAKSLSSKSKV
jgi:hypothetical protein